MTHVTEGKMELKKARRNKDWKIVENVLDRIRIELGVG